ncbi:nucleotidyltransferase domain-containing protein [Halomonas campisalis]|uniref:Nucleotidyltransferase domain-containing protein n=1 Tax=Billgrantia campisalis TaxID=74661 RepID=A0ABS9P8F2_9GAMM|nr:nucleotidyltransferase domain-containing protein [Halomonas campisalis]MCG6658055.1 nucleotidyltransferase domain-containing protein [Halomonas campisalis]MDR5862721.1 nucleotidyltransferase domain-containing protein [Halomonas campisalis]
MRLTDQQCQIIHRIIDQELGGGARVSLFGSRLDDQARGGDIDLLVEVDEPIERPAQLAARLSVRVMRAMRGRKVDILLSAPNLQNLPIHDIAREQGVRL